MKKNEKKSEKKKRLSKDTERGEKIDTIKGKASKETSEDYDMKENEKKSEEKRKRGLSKVVKRREKKRCEGRVRKGEIRRR